MNIGVTLFIAQSAACFLDATILFQLDAQLIEDTIQESTAIGRAVVFHHFKVFVDAYLNRHLWKG